MATFSNRFHVGDAVHVSIIDQLSSFEGDPGASDLGLTIGFEQQHDGKKALRFVPWTSVSSLFKPVD